jgi:glyoxylase-like metal-dependent hydrolase (beta-lactamase superfamily II)
VVRPNRNKLGSFVLAAAILVVLPRTANAQIDFSKVSIKTTPVAPGIHMLSGAGGNIGISSGVDGVFLVDDEFAPLTAKVLAAVKAISDKPIRFLINTHWHFDHTGGNENLGKAGTTIVAHDNVRKTMRVDQMLSAFRMKVPASPKAALPVITFNDTATFHLNGETIVVRHLPPAHTDGDSFVHFRTADVIHAGDIYFNGIYPFIDVDHGGSIDGMIRSAGLIIDVAGQNTKIIPGHGPLSDRRQLIAYRDMLIQIRDRIKTAITDGQTLEQIIASKPLSNFDATWGKGFLDPQTFIRIVHSGMAR